MSKGMDSKKNAKKKPLKTPAEKKLRNALKSHLLLAQNNGLFVSSVNPPRQAGFLLLRFKALQGEKECIFVSSIQRLVA